MAKNDLSVQLGHRINALRRARGLSLAQLTQLTPYSGATLSRIENGLSDISAQNLYALASVFGVQVSAFFEDHAPKSNNGLRAITRKGSGVPFKSKALIAEVLGADLSNKQMNPFLNTVSARNVEDAGGLHQHIGDEFLLVIRGAVILHSEQYSPLTLHQGDSIYFSASDAHAYVNGRIKPSEFLVVTTDTKRKSQP